MKKYPSADLFIEVASEYGVDPSFIEKDWYAVQVLKLLSDHTIDGAFLVFCGGTSLSKGYGLIHRFSEDIDIQIVTTHIISRAERKVWRDAIIALINTHPDLSIDTQSLESRNKSKFFSFNIVYPQIQNTHTALRPHIKLEIIFKDSSLPMEKRFVTSFVSEFMQHVAETSIFCVSPTKTAAEKCSALLCRVAVRDRNMPLGSIQNDPTTVRHLHDLSALESIVTLDNDFVSMVHDAFALDQSRNVSGVNMSLSEAVLKFISILNAEEKYYRAEYVDYVEAVSYAGDDMRIHFDQAYKSFINLMKLVCPVDSHRD